MDIVKKIHEYATIWTFFAFLFPALVILAMMGVFFQSRIMAITGGSLILDVRPWYSFEDAVLLFNILGAEGRALYSQQQLLDAIFPILFGTALSVGIARSNNLREEQDTLWLKLVSVPYLEALFDYLENLLIASQLLNFPMLSPSIIAFASVATVMKWSLLIVSALIFMGSAVKTVMFHRKGGI